MALTTRSATIDEATAGRIDLVVRELAGVSRSQVRGLVDHGCVSINGAPCANGAMVVAVGDVVALRYEPGRRYHETRKPRSDPTFRVVHEDAHLVVVDKIAGMLTVPTDRGETHTLVAHLSTYLEHARPRCRPWVVHRLDRDVSGLLVIAKQEAVATQLIEQFRRRKPERLYAAIVAGVMPCDSGTMRSHLATGNNLDRYSTRPSSQTESAITHYRVLQRGADTTLVEVALETGRRNQIRVHFADAGHPVLGDPRYGRARANHPHWRRNRIALHARTLGFDHPIGGRPLVFESPLPAIFAKFLAGVLRRG